MRIFLCLICIYICFSCSDANKMHVSSYSVFTQNLSLHGETFSLDTILFRYPYRVAVSDSISVVMDLHNADYFFHAFTFPDWEYIESFGKRGEGPEEMTQVASLHMQSPDSIWTLDPNRLIIHRWSIVSATKSVQQVEQINLDKYLVRSLDFYPLNTGFFVPDYMGQYRYHELNLSENRVASVGKIPTRKFYKDAAAPAVAQGWRSFIGYQSDRNLLIMATQLGEVIEIYDLNNEDNNKILIGPNGEPQFMISRNDGIPNGIMGFNDVFVGDRYIYAIFQGAFFKDIASNIENGGKNEQGGRHIYVFDFEGIPVCDYTLDCAISGIYVDERDGYIWGVSINNDNPIIRFKLSLME